MDGSAQARSMLVERSVAHIEIFDEGSHADMNRRISGVANYVCNLLQLLHGLEKDD